MKVARRGGNDFYSLIGIRKNKSLFVGIKEVLKHNSVKKIISVTTVKVSHTEEKKKTFTSNSNTTQYYDKNKL